MLKLVRRLVVWSLLAAVMLTALLVFQLLRFQHGAIALESGPSVFLIRSGSNIKSIAQDLARAKIINDPWLFILLAKVRGLETRVRAGEYQINAGLTADELLEKFIRGNAIAPADDYRGLDLSPDAGGNCRGPGHREDAAGQDRRGNHGVA